MADLNPYSPANLESSVSVCEARSKWRRFVVGAAIGCSLPLLLGGYGLLRFWAYNAALPAGTAACGNGALTPMTVQPEMSEPYRPPLKTDELDAEPQQLPSKTRFVVECVTFPFVVAASVPLMWIGFLMLGGWRDGNPYRIFNDRILWDDEFNAKVPAMVMISILGFGVTLAEIVESRNDLKRSRRKEDLD